MNTRRDDWATNVTSSFTHASLRLQPYRIYNCCVAAVNEAGRGNSSCQAIITHEAGKLSAIHRVVADKLTYNTQFQQLPPLTLKYISSATHLL